MVGRDHAETETLLSLACTGCAQKNAASVDWPACQWYGQSAASQWSILLQRSSPTADDGAGTPGCRSGWCCCSQAGSIPVRRQAIGRWTPGLTAWCCTTVSAWRNSSRQSAGLRYAYSSWHQWRCQGPASRVKGWQDLALALTTKQNYTISAALPKHIM